MVTLTGSSTGNAVTTPAEANIAMRAFFKVNMVEKLSSDFCSSWAGDLKMVSRGFPGIQPDII